jgi:hypothetical protein
MMKRLFLTGIAALFLATGTAHAQPLYDDHYDQLRQRQDWQQRQLEDQQLRLQQRQDELEYKQRQQQWQLENERHNRLNDECIGTSSYRCRD